MMIQLLIPLMLMMVASSIVTASMGGITSDQGEILAEYPNQPRVFNTPEELRSYLQELDKYFAIVGRPRFGRTVGDSGYPRSFFPYFRGNPLPPSF